MSKSKILEPFAMQESQFSKYKCSISGLLSHVSQRVSLIKVEPTNSNSMSDVYHASVGQNGHHRSQPKLIPTNRKNKDIDLVMDGTQSSSDLLPPLRQSQMSNNASNLGKILCC